MDINVLWLLFVLTWVSDIDKTYFNSNSKEKDIHSI